MSSRPSPSRRQAFDLVADPARLFRAIPDADDLDLLAIAGVGPQRLAEAAGIVCDEAVCGGKDVRRRAVVLLEPDDLRAGEILFEAEDVRDLGAAPAVDRLIVVADARRDCGEARRAASAIRTGPGWCPDIRRRGCSGSGRDRRSRTSACLRKMTSMWSSRSPKSQAFSVLQPVLILRVELGATAGREGFGFAGVDLGRSPAAVLPAIDEPGELARRPALFVEVRRPGSAA